KSEVNGGSQVRSRKKKVKESEVEQAPLKHLDALELKQKLKERLDIREQRSYGDGDSVPSTPPKENGDVSGDEATETIITKESCSKKKTRSGETKRSEPKKPHHPFVISVQMDFMVGFLFLISLITRLVFLDLPRNVVFDEMHYGKYASLYLKGTFFFDANPPLGKLILALAGYFAGYEGDFEFQKIGVPYPENFPLMTLRLIPALCGSLITPTVYLILGEMGLSNWAGALAALMVVLDTAILAQSRFILLESMMMLFALFAILSVLKFRRFAGAPFSMGWCFWILMTSVNMGLAFSVKFIGIYSCWLCSFLLLRSFWKRLSLKQVSNLQLFFEFSSQAVLICVIPILVYVGSFYIHLSILTKAGVHDSLMTSAFQASLEGGLSSIVDGQPKVIAHGSQITLRHTHGKTCWLHSHEHVYPIRYDDGRGSSHQQQVSCYSYKDVNNWWIVKRPDREDLAVHEPLDSIKDGDTIQLVHGMTHRALNSHDVAAPMSPHNQEITCYIDYNISMASENLWKVQIVNMDNSGEESARVWQSIGSQIRLIHVNTNQAMKFSPRLYPEWGFHQNEVAADKNHDQLDTIWNVEEHRYTKHDEDKRTLERELFNAELIPQTPTYLSFWQKFWELQVKMLITNQDNVQNHNYASYPGEWPFLVRGIAYFISKDSNAQVHLIGNIMIWYTGTLSVLAYSTILIIYLLRRRRLCFDVPEDVFQEFVEVGEVLMAGYLFHFVPFLFYDRTLFIHHYLLAYVFKLMLTAFLMVHIYEIAMNVVSRKWLARLVAIGVVCWILATIYVFVQMSPFCYGFFPMSASQMGKSQFIAQTKFAWACLVIQVVVGILFFLLVRYDDSADATHTPNRLGHNGHNEKLQEAIEKYPMIVDIHMMLFAGFGFLMTFLKRYGFSAIGFTMMITVLVTEWAILVQGFLHMDDHFTIKISYIHILEGGLAAAAVLISFGAVLGKLNPLQLITMCLIEGALFVLNAYLGYIVLGAVDVGGAIFIHTFGAYFGLAVSLMARKRDVAKSERREGSTATTDLFAMLGTVILWVYWPSFNAVLASHDALHRAYINTYISLIASTMITFVVSAFFGEGKRLDMVDIQNATLSGGVAVGAIADLMINPYGAFLAGTLVGLVSSLGYRILQGKLFDKLKLHDTCGVHNLHGLPGFLSGIFSIMAVGLASEDSYGPSLYSMFPRCAPVEGSDEMKRLLRELPSLEPGEGRPISVQAMIQLACLGVTVILAIVMGLMTGLVLNIDSIFHPLNDEELYDDIHYWALPDEEDDTHGVPSQKGGQPKSDSSSFDLDPIGVPGTHNAVYPSKQIV
ncbi:hypothetical protein TCAL_03556, partial [Tigriopus californicus]